METMGVFVYEFAVCNKIFNDKSIYLRFVSDSIAGILAVELYLDDSVNILRIKSSINVEAEIFRVFKERDISIKYLWPRRINDSQES